MVTARSKGGTVFNIDIEYPIYGSLPPNVEPVSVSNTHWNAIEILVSNIPDKIPAVRVIRLMTGLGIKEALDLFDMAAEHMQYTGCH